MSFVHLNTDMFLRKILGALAAGTVVWANPAAMVNLENTYTTNSIQAVFAALIGGKVAGFDLNTTWILRLSTATTLGALAGGYFNGSIGFLEGIPLMPVGAAAGFFGTSIWPDAHPLFN